MNFVALLLDCIIFYICGPDPHDGVDISSVLFYNLWHVGFVG